MKDLKGLLKKRKKFIDKIDELKWDKLPAHLLPGNHISIKWVNDEYEDYGYVFSLPDVNDDYYDYDLFFHIPNPDNPGGIGDAPEVFGHLCDLIENELVKEIKIIKKLKL